MGNFPMKRLNRLRKLAQGQNLEDYFRQNLTQNWKAIEDTFSGNKKQLNEHTQLIENIEESANDLASTLSSLSSTVSSLSSTVSSLSSTVSSLSSAVSSLEDFAVFVAKVSDPSGSFNTNSTTFVNVTNLTLSFSTLPCWIMAFVVNSAATSRRLGSTSGNGIFRWMLNGSPYSTYSNGFNSTAPDNGPYDFSNLFQITTTGSHTISVQARTTDGVQSYCEDKRLVLIQIRNN